MRELSIEQRLTSSIKRLGGKAIKGENVSGFPDRIVLMPGGRVYFVEVKQPKGRMSDLQECWKEDLLKLGMNYRTLWHDEDLKDFLNEVGG